LVALLITSLKDKAPQIFFKLFSYHNMKIISSFSFCMKGNKKWVTVPAHVDHYSQMH